MRATKRRDTGPELALRRELHRRGLRYRVDIQVTADLRRRADVIFTRAKVAVFVDGCFWHGCPIHASRPKANADFWADKLAANQTRDRDTDVRLAAAGWRIVRIWEHEDAVVAADRVAQAVEAPPSPLHDRATSKVADPSQEGIRTVRSLP